MAWLRQLASEGGAWMVFGVVSIGLIAAALYWRIPPVDGVEDDPITWWGTVKFVVTMAFLIWIYRLIS